ncbi:alpha/beta fold hydrolase [Gordonia shandongensis]|uniref:alpha/beta fold hydrolase n=1 Tax=Gordonia shandongensis TaxID=376351 RepID=UPI0003FAA909|nr:alpha/beta fold hydrolase [Gordonia shandongensis]
MRNALTSALSTLIAAAALASVAACTPERSPDDAYHGYEITWDDCSDERRDNLSDTVRCGTMTLPVDWSRPSGDTFTTHVYRQAADGPRRGTIMSFPSGPGSTADVGLTELADLAPGYDFVGIDPRGVADTAPVQCSASAILKAPLVTPADPAAFARTRDARTAIAPSCVTEPASLRDHMDAYSNAKDAEAFRQALGGHRVVTTGTSYGTLLAFRYLELFGHHAAGAVLDGVMNPGEDPVSFQTVAARGDQAGFDEFAAWCRTDRRCTVPHRDAARTLATARRVADRGLIPGVDAMGRRWAGAGVLAEVQTSIGNDDFPAAARTLAELAARRNPIRDHGTAIAEGTLLPYPDVIVCSDFDLGIRDADTARRTAAAAARGNAQIPYSTNAYAYSVVCSGAPHPAESAANPVTLGGDVSVMLLSHRIDTATPIAWAQRVERALGGRARHLVVDGVGHGGSIRDPAVRAAVTDYLHEAAV